MPREPEDGDWARWTRDAVAAMHDRMDALMGKHGIVRGAPFVWNLDDATLGVASQGRETLLHLLCTGTLSHESGTFRWAWGNGYLPPVSTARMEEVRAFGEAHGRSRLTDVEWPATPAEAFEMMATAGWLLDADGMWVDRSGPVTLYFVVFEDPEGIAPS